MSKVSIYPHIKESKFCDIVELDEVFTHIKSNTWQEPIEALRTQIAFGATPAEVEKIKQKLPYFTGSGTFSERKITGLIQHSGKIVIDFDHVKNLEIVRSVLIADKYTEYLFLSCSGTGLAIVVTIDPAQHLNSFLFLEKYYKDTYNLELDKSCKDVPRARYISYDPNLFHNPNALPVLVGTDITPVKATPASDHIITASVGASFSVDTDEGKYNWCKAVHEKKQSYVTGNRHNYITIFAFFLNKCGVNHDYALNRILSEFVNAEKGADEYTRVVRDTYMKALDDFGTFKINKSFEEMPPEYVTATKQIFAHANGVNRAGRDWDENTDVKALSNKHNLPVDVVRNIFRKVFEKNQDEHGIDDKPDIFKVENFIKKKWLIVKNEVTHRIEGKLRKSDHPVSIINIDEIYREISKVPFKFALDKLKSLIRSEFIEEYNPFEKYFTELPAWDQIDHIDALSSHIITDDQSFWQIQFKKALVRNIACTLEKKRVNRIIMTLVGEDQETGKSSFINFLCPPKLSDYYTESPLDNTKDSDIQLSENFIWNLEELAALSAVEINKLKAIISKVSVKQRAAYAAFADVNPRRVNFWASTNKLDFLTDTQNTRWLCFSVKSINFDYNNINTGVKNVDIDKVWAQAYTLYKSGYNYSLTAEEIEKRNLINKEFENSSFEKEMLLDTFKQAEYPYGDFMTNSDIMIKLGDKIKNKHNLNIYSIARAMKQLGFISERKKISGRAVRGYRLIERTALDSEDEVTPFDKPL